MASREDYKVLTENIEGSNDSTSHTGSTEEYLTATGCSVDSSTASGSSEATDKNKTRRFAEFSQMYLEPSPSKVPVRRARSRNLLEKPFSRSWLQPSSEAPTSSSYEDEQQADEPRTNYCATLMKCYKICVRKIRSSWLIHIIQCLISLVCVSAIALGIIYFRSCEGKFPSNDPIFLIALGISGLFVIYMWVAKVFGQLGREYNGDSAKHRFIMKLVSLFIAWDLAFIYMTGKKLQIYITGEKLEIHPSPEEKEVECIKTYYAYLHYLYIANAVSFVLAALLYLPECCLYAYVYRRLVRTQHD